MAKEILIADSDKMVQKEFEKIFEATDYQIIFSKTNEEALLRGRVFKPDLIIGGRDLCSSVRADVELKDLPFILMINIFDDLSESERKLLRVDGMISKPFNEDKILNTVDRLMVRGKEGTEGIGISEDDLDWKSFSDIGKSLPEKKEELSLNGMGESEEEEIIELVDVVEEPESRMSIDDFAIQQKEESIGEIAPMEQWGKQEEMEKSTEEELLLPSEGKKEEMEEMTVSLEEKIEKKEISPEKEFFEKIELEEVLLKMESLQPSMEKEWPATKEEKIVKEDRTASKRAEERYQDLKEFEAALKGKVEVESTEEELQPFYIEEPKAEFVKVAVPVEPTKETELQELSEEEFPEAFLEELEQELGKVEEEEVTPVETEEDIEEEEFGEDEISKFFEEEVKVTEKVLEQPFEEPEAVEELTPVEELKEVEVESLEPLKAPEILEEQFPSPPVRLDRNIEEVISKGVQEMMQDFITKIIPGMTQNVLILTLDRIEKMVKEIVPDLAEKVIQEEIKRLQRGEKD